MNIGIVTTWFERGAAYVSRQYREALKDKHSVYIYARGGESYAVGDPAWDHQYVHWGAKPDIPIPTAVDMADFQKWLEKFQIEVVFFNEQHWWYPVIFCNKLGLITGAYVDYYTEDTVPLFANYDFLICNTKRHYSVFEWHPQCYYIPWGTDLNLFRPKEYNMVSQGQVTFFHSCGFSPERKGTDFLLKAFYDLQASDLKLIIHTQTNLSERLPAVAGIIHELQSNNRLEVIEKTVPAPGLYYMGDIYVYPSRLDGLGLTIVEALASGLPVIASDNAPMNEFVEHEKNGRLVKIDKFTSRADGYYWPQSLVDLEDLKTQMMWYLKNKVNIANFKKFVHEYALQNFDWMKNMSNLSSLLFDVNKLPSDIVLKAEERAIEFENKCYQNSLAFLAQKYPKSFRLASVGLKAYKKAKAFLR